MCLLTIWIRGKKINAWWYNPRDEKCYTETNLETNKPFSEYPITEGQVHEFDPPGNHGLGHNWILILDEANTGYLKP